MESDMGWATAYIAKLKGGETLSFRPRGGSMSPKIESGQLCTVAPVNASDVRVGDIVVCKVNGTEYLHLVKAIQDRAFRSTTRAASTAGLAEMRSLVDS
jgi:hypothetical protein